MQVDLCGGFWLARTEWLRSMFVEPPLTWESGEDFHLTAMMRKHEGLPTFLLPSDLGDEATWGHTQDFIDISAAGDSTSDFMHKYRSNIAYGLMHRGYEPVHAADTHGERHQRASVVLLVRSAADGAATAPLYEALTASRLGAYVRVHVVLALDPRGERGGGDDGDGGAEPPAAAAGAGAEAWDRSVKAALLHEHFGVEFDHAARVVGVWDLNLGRVPALIDVADLPPPRGLERLRLSRAPIHVATRAATVMAGVLDTLRPALVVAVHDEASAVSAGVALAASTARVPLLGLALPRVAACGAAGAAGAAGAGGATNSDLARLRLWSTAGGGAGRAWTGSAGRPVCEPHHPWTVPRGAYSAVTNSATGALAYVADTLCACEAPDSAAGRAYARCPTDVGVAPAAPVR